MAWLQFSHGFRLDPIDRGSPEALVVLLQDFGSSAGTLMPIAARWAAAVPTTAFVVLDGTEFTSLHTTPDSDADCEPMVFDRATRHLMSLLGDQLHSRRLDVGRLVLAGFGHGGTLALHMLLRQGWGGAGVLAFSAKPVHPPARIQRVDHKIRLVECAEGRDIDDSGLRDFVAMLAALGIDARGVSLASPATSDESIRYGGAYLVELVATAQRKDRFRITRAGRGSTARPRALRE
jgi:predicted esterase